MIQAGNMAKIQMEKVLRMQDKINENEYDCQVLEYNEKEERLTFLLRSGSLEQLNLDAVYQCRIQQNEECYVCQGTIRERFLDERGKVFVVSIENGFYKINLKSVDKKEV